MVMVPEISGASKSFCHGAHRTVASLGDISTSFGKTSSHWSTDEHETQPAMRGSFVFWGVRFGFHVILFNAACFRGNSFCWVFDCSFLPC